MKDKKVGKITHYYNHLGVGIVKLSAPLVKGDKVRIAGHGREFIQTIGSMQFDHQDLQEAKKGKEVGVKVDEKVKDGDVVFKVEA